MAAGSFSFRASCSRKMASRTTRERGWLWRYTCELKGSGQLINPVSLGCVDADGHHTIAGFCRAGTLAVGSGLGVRTVCWALAIWVKDVGLTDDKQPDQMSTEELEGLLQK